MSSPTKRSFAVLSVLKIFFHHLRKYKWLAGLVVLMNILNEVAQNLALPYTSKLIFDKLAGLSPDASAINQLLPNVELFAACAIGALILGKIMNGIIVYMQPYMMSDLEQSGFAYLLGHSFQYFQDNFSGSLVRRISRFGRAFEELSDAFVQKLIPILVAFIGILWIVFSRNLLIGGLVSVWIVVMLAYNFFYARWKNHLDILRAEQDSKCTGFLADALSNVQTVKLFTGIERETKNFKHESEKLRDMRWYSWKHHMTNFSIQSFILLLLQVTVLWISIHYWSQGQLSAGDIILFQAYFSILNARLLDFSRLIRTFYNAFADATEMIEILDKPYDVKDKRGAKKLTVRRGEVSFDHVIFSYHSRPVIHDMSLTIKHGEKVALVGSSGAGKSTVIKLLLRFYDLTSGSIKIDGKAIDQVTQDSLREHIALVPQEPILFHRSLLENVRYGRPDASDEQVIKASKLAHCHEFIQDFPQQYETLVGERGVKLSGGERQRVAIARAILKNAPILILDEATSSLDSESERLIQDALNTLMKGKTTIVIAHRLSTIMSMDRIIILDKGRVVDSGTHEQLIKREGIYKKLWSIQAGGFLQDQEV